MTGQQSPIEDIRRLHLTVYDAEGAVGTEAPSRADLVTARGGESVTWLEVRGPVDETLGKMLGEVYGLHRLTVEDIVERGQRTKVDALGDYLFMALRRPLLHGDRLVTEQVALVVSSCFVITVTPSSTEETINARFLRERLDRERRKRGSLGTDFLSYAILDSLIDAIAPLADALSEELSRLEDILMEGAPPDDLGQAIFRVRHDLATLRRSLMPMAGVLGRLANAGSVILAKGTLPYFKDCEDQARRLLDTVTTWHDYGTSLMELMLSQANQKLSEVMKVLTIISTIFIPLTFLAGIYGMNFSNMPELTSPVGYPVAIGFMGLLVVFQLFYFRRKGWLGRRRGASQAVKG